MPDGGAGADAGTDRRMTGEHREDQFASVMGVRRGSGRADPSVERTAWRWWRFEEEELTHMDLRRWFDDRHAEGWRVMRVEAVPADVIRDADRRYQVVLFGSRARHRERVLWPSELEWLLRAWPAELRTRGPYDGLLTA